jgi:hypothetical protein
MQVISPMRQAWINSLREKLAELIGYSLHYYQAGYEDRSDAEYRRMTLLSQEVELMLNPIEDTPRLLIAEMRKMLGSINEHVLSSKYAEHHEAVVSLSREVLKAEWEATKSS